MKEIYFEILNGELYGRVLVPFLKSEKLKTFDKITPDMLEDLNIMVERYLKGTTEAERTIILSGYAPKQIDSNDPAKQFMGSILNMTAGISSLVHERTY